jgi:hypothetical protein
MKSAAARVTTAAEGLSWLKAVMVDRLGAMRRPGESYNDVILRLVVAGGGKLKRGKQ